MSWKCNLPEDFLLKEKYYYCDSEYYIMGAVLAELLLDLLIAGGSDIFNSRLDIIVVGAFLAIVPLVYFLYCFYNSYKSGKVKLEIGNEDILIYRLYLLKPYRIKKEHVISVTAEEKKRKTIIEIRTIKRKYIVKIYNR